MWGDVRAAVCPLIRHLPVSISLLSLAAPCVCVCVCVYLLYLLMSWYVLISSSMYASVCVYVCECVCVCVFLECAALMNPDINFNDCTVFSIFVPIDFVLCLKWMLHLTQAICV